MKLYGHRPATEVKGKLFPIERVSGLSGKQSRQSDEVEKPGRAVPILMRGIERLVEEPR
jgi:hypothetical protein